MRLYSSTAPEWGEASCFRKAWVSRRVAKRRASCWAVRASRPAAAPAGDLRDLQEEHLAGELDGALALAAAGGYLRPYAARAVLLAPQVVDLLLVEVPLLQRVGRIPQAVGLFERLRYPAFFHGPVFTLCSRSHAPKPLPGPE